MKNAKENAVWLWQNAEKVLIVTFFLTFTLNIRKVFLTPYSFLNGGFNEYMTMSFSWADALILATIVIYTTKSILRQVINSYYASPGHGKVFEKPFTNVSRETLYLLVFLGWVGLSIFWSRYQPISTYRFLTFIEIALFAFIVVKSLNQPKWLKLAFFAIILNGLFQSLLGIAQFVHNSSLSLCAVGESIVGPNIDGVAKILINGEKHIRTYGTFPHPNILAGFLIIPLFLLLGEIIFRRLLPLYKGETERGSDANHQDLTPALSLSSLPTGVEERGSLNNVPHETFLGFIPNLTLYAILLITGLGFFLTFSRSAFFGFFIGFLIFLVGSSYMRSPGGILKSNFKFSISLIIALIFITILLLTNTSFFSNQSLQERTLYQNVSYETFLKHPLAGVGIGQFVMSEYQNHPSLESWQYQPVHNIYLLAFSELGIVGLIFFLLWVFSTLEWGSGKNRNTGLLLTRLSICCIILSFLFIAFFDHYFWDIKSGTIIFVLPIILILALAMNSKKCSTDFLGLL